MSSDSSGLATWFSDSEVRATQGYKRKWRHAAEGERRGY